MLQATAWAQAPGSYIDPPGRVARLNLMEGAVSFSPADIAASQDASAWTPAMLNRPLTRGDRLWTGSRARAELHIGSTAVRMSEQTSLDFLVLDDDVVQLRLAQGTLRLRVRTLFEGQRLEINTPNLAFVISQPGDYRLDANLATDTTRVVVQSGGGTVYGDSGLPVTLASQQQASFTGTQLTPGAPGSTVLDSFDLWALERDRLEDQSVSARYVPREVTGYQQLDLYGDWSQDPTYGAVWLPRAVPVHWAPYRMGYWSWIAPWGWTWIDDAPWGFAPCHYGRWALIGQRWAWVPGRLTARPVYAPALVVFVGGSSGGVNWSISIGSGGAPRPALGWFPLAPGEAFRPIYRVSPRYVTQVNQNIVVNTTVNVTNVYRYQRQPAAVTVVSADDFSRGRPVRGNLALNLAELNRAPVVVDRSAIPQRPDVQRPRLAAAAALPPAPVVTQPVVRGRDERREERRDGRAQPALPAAPATQGLIGAQPPARPGQIIPPALQDRSAADTEQRARREQQQLQREQERQQQEATRPQDAQRRPGEESLIQRAQRERQQGGMPAASPDARTAAERNAIDTEQRARREQQQQQLQREQERQQREAAQQQEAQRRQNEESLIQRAQRERAAAAERGAVEQAQRAQQQLQREQQQLQREQERKQHEAAQQQEAQRRQNEESLIQRAQRERAAAAERSAVEQAQRAQQQLQREQERQQRELIRQQDQQRRQNEELQGQRALREQAQRAQAAQAAQAQAQAQQRQAHELQQQQQQQQEQRKAQQRKQAREADAANAPGPRPEGLPGRFREQ